MYERYEVIAPSCLMERVTSHPQRKKNYSCSGGKKCTASGVDLRYAIGRHRTVSDAVPVPPPHLKPAPNLSRIGRTARDFGFQNMERLMRAIVTRPISSGGAHSFSVCWTIATLPPQTSHISAGGEGRGGLSLHHRSAVFSTATLERLLSRVYIHLSGDVRKTVIDGKYTAK